MRTIKIENRKYTRDGKCEVHNRRICGGEIRERVSRGQRCNIRGRKSI
jgi:hypothetical protein